jgi:NAD(P)H-hydrate epimerase
MRVLNTEQMREADRRTIQDLGIPARELMERAGQQVAAVVMREFAPVRGKSIAVLCGRGNNGGDGFVVARALAEEGADVRALVVGAIDGVKGDARDALEGLQAVHGAIEVADAAAWAGQRQAVGAAVVIVDAITGTGFHPPLTGLAGTVIDDVNAMGKPVVAVDLPSGLSADSASVNGEAIEAAITVALAAPKLPHVLAPAEGWVGRWEVADIGIPATVIDALRGPSLDLVTPARLRALVPRRPRTSHKGHFGRVLIVAGSLGKTGAAYLSAMGALRSGAGLVTVATPKSCVPIVAALGAEYMTWPMPEDEAGRMTAAALEELLAFNADVMAVGPGLGRSPGLDTLVAGLAARWSGPMVIDADGLNALAASTVFASRSVVLTPHPGEMAALAGLSIEAVQHDRLGVAQRVAAARRAHVVLKGHRTLVTSPDGHVSINDSGNPGMATAGTGDVLTGVTAAWLAQLRDPAGAATLAVYVHGRAGDLAAAAQGEVAMVAGDLLLHLGAAVRELTPSS